MTKLNDHLSLYFKLAGARIGGQMQYPVSFVMGILISFFASFVDVIGLYIIFDRFSLIRGWEIAEVCLLYGLLHMSFAIVEGIARGFDSFGRLIRTGQLDRILVRPQPIILQVLGQEFKSSNLGRFVQGLIPFLYATTTLHIVAPWQLALIGLVLFNCMTIFFSILLVQATLSFWAQDSLEVMNAFTYGGMQMGQYPLSIYEKWFARFFTFVVPIGLCAFFPVLIILQKTADPYFNEAQVLTALGPFLCLGFLTLSLRFFKYGLKQYTSTGS